MFVTPRITVLELKHDIQEKFGYNATQINLGFSGKILEDHRTLESYNIRQGDNVHVLPRLLGGFDFFVIKEDFLDPSYDYDFTHLKDNGATYTRGKHLYKRPYGWKRIALNVSGKYGSDDKWLGCVGDSSDEWPVSYHGTKKDFANSITSEGYRLDKRKRSAYGIGIYSSPEVGVAEGYACAFDYDGVNYKCVFQNRVNPVGLQKHYNDMYWVTPNEDDIRPYGFCVKKV